jgi:hypothetical protein
VLGSWNLGEKLFGLAAAKNKSTFFKADGVHVCVSPQGGLSRAASVRNQRRPPGAPTPSQPQSLHGNGRCPAKPASLNRN